MADKVRYAISLTPIEEVTEYYGFASEDVDILTDNATRTVEVIATEVQETLGASSANIALGTNFATMTNSTHGTTSGTPYYLSAPGATGGLQMPAVASCDILYIENTGFRQSSSSTTKGTTVNTTDYLTVEVGDNGTIVAILAANEAVVLPMRGGTNSNAFYISSTAANGTSAGGNTLGAKFLSLT